jgi:hypothetical protein
VSERDEVLDRFEKYIRQGDWNAAGRLTNRIANERLPADPKALNDRLRRLENVLVAARVARAGLAVSLARLRAAASFTHSRVPPARQKFAIPADF